jgi:hypothetical protein
MDTQTHREHGVLTSLFFFQNNEGMVWIGLIWLRIGTGGGLL